METSDIKALVERGKWRKQGVRRDEKKTRWIDLSEWQIMRFRGFSKERFLGCLILPICTETKLLGFHDFLFVKATVHLLAHELNLSFAGEFCNAPFSCFETSVLL
jgi:hypothetical protein